MATDKYVMAAILFDAHIKFIEKTDSLELDSGNGAVAYFQFDRNGLLSDFVIEKDAY